MQESREDLFPLEFKHETVQRVVRGLVDRSVRRPDDRKLPDYAIKRLAKLTFSVQRYCKQDTGIEEKKKAEQEIFEEYMILKMLGYLIEDNLPTSRIEAEMKNINSKIDSTNSLLAETLKILKLVLKKLEGSTEK